MRIYCSMYNYKKSLDTFNVTGINNPKGGWGFITNVEGKIIPDSRIEDIVAELGYKIRYIEDNVPLVKVETFMGDVQAPIYKKLLSYHTTCFSDIFADNRKLAVFMLVDRNGRYYNETIYCVKIDEKDNYQCKILKWLSSEECFGIDLISLENGILEYSFGAPYYQYKKNLNEQCESESV